MCKVLKIGPICAPQLWYVPRLEIERHVSVELAAITIIHIDTWHPPPSFHATPYRNTL